MDHYETRTWRGWHHHQTLTILAHHFLVRLRVRSKKKPQGSPSRRPVCCCAPCCPGAHSIRSTSLTWSAASNGRTMRRIGHIMPGSAGPDGDDAMSRCSIRTEYAEKCSLANECGAVPPPQCSDMTARGSSGKDLHSQPRARCSAIEHQPTVPGPYATIPFCHQLRMAPPPQHLTESFSLARTPVGANAQVPLPSRPQREDPLAAVATDDLSVPSPHQLEETHPQGCHRGKPGTQVLGQRRTLILQVEQQAVISGRHLNRHHSEKVVEKADRGVESPLPVRDWTGSSPPLGMEVAAVDLLQRHAAGTPSNATGIASPTGCAGAMTGGVVLRASRRLASCCLNCSTACGYSQATVRRRSEA